MAQSKAGPAARPKVFYGWWVVAATATLMFYGGGTFFYAFGAFLNPIKETFGWSTGAIALAFSLRSAEAGLAGPLVGYAVDSIGARRVVFFGVLVAGLGFILLSRVNSLATFYGAYAILTIGTSCSLGVPGMTAVGNWFVKKRGLALGIFTAGAGLSGVLVPVVVWLIDRYQWRTTMVILGTGMWLVGIPLTLLLRHRPEKYGLLPDGEAVGETGPEDVPQQVEGFTLRQTLRDRSFWLLSFAFLLSMAALTSVTIFAIAHLEDSGFSKELAGFTITLLTLSSLIGRLGFGWLGDYYNKRRLLLGLFVLNALGLLTLAWVRSAWQLVPFLLIFAPSYGGIISLRVALMGEYFGRRSFGVIQGMAMDVMSIGGIATPFLMGSLRDATGTYGWSYLIIGSALLLAIPLLLAARQPPLPPGAKDWRVIRRWGGREPGNAPGRGLGPA